MAWDATFYPTLLCILEQTFWFNAFQSLEKSFNIIMQIHLDLVVDEG